MSLSTCNLYAWSTRKTVKLSDTYQVYIKLYDADAPAPYNSYIGLVEVQECTNVKLPTYKYKEEIYDYGNNSKKFIIPDYNGLEDLELEFIENYTDDDKPAIRNLVDACLGKLFDQEKFAYKLADYIPEIVINIFTNNFNRHVLQYRFTNLKLTDYSTYDLDYSSSNIAKWTLKFSYQTYEVHDMYQDQIDNYIKEQELRKKAEEEEYKRKTIAYEKMREAQTMAYSRGRGVPTPNEDLDMAQDYLENVKKAEPKIERFSKEKEILALEASRPELEKQLELAKQQLAADETEHRNRLEIHAKAVKAYEEYTESTTRRQREKKGELWDAERLALENRTAAMEQVRNDRAKISELEKQIENIDTAKEKITADEINRINAINEPNQKAYQEKYDTAMAQVNRLQNTVDRNNALTDINESIRMDEPTVFDDKSYAEAMSKQYSNIDTKNSSIQTENELIKQNKIKNQEEAQKRLYDDYYAGVETTMPDLPDIDTAIQEPVEQPKSDIKANVQKIENVLGELTRPEYFELPDIDTFIPDTKSADKKPTGQQIMENAGLNQTTQKILYDKQVIDKQVKNLSFNDDYQNKVTEKIKELHKSNPDLDEQILYEKASNEVQNDMLRNGGL